MYILKGLYAVIALSTIKYPDFQARCTVCIVWGKVTHPTHLWLKVDNPSDILALRSGVVLFSNSISATVH